MGLTKAQLEALNISSFPDNTTGLITPAVLRGYNTASITNTVNQDAYTTDSASLVTSITELNTFSASALVSISNLNTNSASVNISITELNASSASQQISIDSLNAATASYVTSAITASSLVTASFDNGTRNLTFTKGDASTFNVNIPDVSGSAGNFVTTSSFNAYTSSNDQRVTALETNSASVNTSVTNINNTTASLNTSASLGLTTASVAVNVITFTKGDSSTFDVTVADTTDLSSLNTFSASALISISNLNTNSGSVNTSITNINSATASLFTSTSLSLITASFDTGTRDLTFTKGDTQTFSVNIPDVSGSGGGFATLGANTFTGSQTISSSISVSGSANFVGGDVNFTDQSRNINIDVDGTIIKGQKAVLISQSLDIENTLTASLANGFTYVGNASGRTATVATSSFETPIPIGTISGSAQITAFGFVSSSQTVDTGSFVTTSSFNAYTASQSTASIDNSISALNTFSSSTLVSLSNLNSYTSSQQLLNGTFATTGSNAFIGSNTFDGNFSIITDPSVTNIIISASADNNHDRKILSVLNGTTIFPNSGSNLFYDGIAIGARSGSNLSAAVSEFAVDYNNGPSMFWSPNRSDMANSNRIRFKSLNDTTQSVQISTGLFQLHNNGSRDDADYGKVISFPIVPGTDGQYLKLVDSNGTVGFGSIDTGASLITASVAVNVITFTKGDATTFDITVADTTDLSSLNTFTASAETSINALNTFSSSTLVSLTNLNSTTASLNISASLSLVTASFAGNTLTFTKGDNTTFGVVIPDVSGSLIPAGTVSGSTQIVELGFVTTASFNAYTQSNDLRVDSLEAATASYATSAITASSLVTASVLLNTITFTKGDSSIFALTVDTGSGGGGAAFPYTGDAQISGSLGVTGSLNGFVNSLAIASSTASLDFNNGNFFTLQLVGGSTTHLAASNIRPGQTINLLVKTDSGAAADSGSLTFSPDFKFAGGFDYTPTQITASQDLVSFVTFDTTQIFVGQIKNLS